MITGSSLVVVIDKGPQYNVIVENLGGSAVSIDPQESYDVNVLPPDVYGVNVEPPQVYNVGVQPPDTYTVNIEPPRSSVLLTTGSFLSNAEFAVNSQYALTSSYVLLGDVDGFVEYSGSVYNEIFQLSSIIGTGSGGPFAPVSQLEATASFLQGQIDERLLISSFNTYTQSIDDSLLLLDQRIAILETSGSLGIDTGSFATTASNVFYGDQQVTGSVKISKDGLLILSPRQTPSITYPGGMFYSHSGEFYVGIH